MGLCHSWCSNAIGTSGFRPQAERRRPLISIFISATTPAYARSSGSSPGWGTPTCDCERRRIELESRSTDSHRAGIGADVEGAKLLVEGVDLSALVARKAPCEGR